MSALMAAGLTLFLVTLGGQLRSVVDGSDGVQAIPDTDHGRLDGDSRWDRAVGPMQFIPMIWAKWGSDGNGDGVADPNQIDDAALAAGRLLCAGGDDLTQPYDWRHAVLQYNASGSYADLVLAKANAYAQASLGQVLIRRG